MIERSKIGRLPERIRNELNQRLLEGQTGPKILAWLNSIPEAAQVIAEMPTAGGKTVCAFDDKNLSSWRNGSYARWRQRRERLAEQREMASYSLKLAKAAGGDMAAGPAALVASELLDLMETLRDLREQQSDLQGSTVQSSTVQGSSDSPDQPDPSARLLAISKAVDSVSKAIASIRAGDHSAAKIALDRRKVEQADESLRLERIRVSALLDKAAARLLDETLRRQAADIANSSLSNAEKIAALRKAAFSDVDALEASGKVQLPA